MRPIIIYIISILTAAAILSCVAKEVNEHIQENKGIKTVIAGFLPQFADSTVTVYLEKFDGTNLINYSVGNLSTQTKNGYFKFEMMLNEMMGISCAVEDVHLFRNFLSVGSIVISPGDSINMIIPDINQPRISGIQFSGKGAEKQIWLQDFSRSMMESIIGMDLRNISLEEYIKFAIGLQAKGEKMIGESALSKKKQGLYQSYLLMRSYYNIRQRLAGQDLTDPKIRELYREQFLKNFPLKEDLRNISYFNVNGWLWILVDYAKFDYATTHGQIITGNYKDPFVIYNLLEKSYDDHPLKEPILASYLLSVIKMKGYDETLDNLVAQFNQEVPENNIIENSWKRYGFNLLISYRKNPLPIIFLCQTLPEISGH